MYSTHSYREDPPRRCRFNQCEWLEGGCGTNLFGRFRSNKGVVGGQGQEGFPEVLFTFTLLYNVVDGCSDVVIVVVVIIVVGIVYVVLVLHAV